MASLERQELITGRQHNFPWVGAVNRPALAKVWDAAIGIRRSANLHFGPLDPNIEWERGKAAKMLLEVADG